MAADTGPRGGVLITGASSGIGRACALHLDSLGFQVFAGETCAERWGQEGSERLRPITLDVTDPEQITAAAETVTRTVGSAGLVGLVNNAGISYGGPLEMVPIEEFRRILEVNVLGVVAVTQAFLPLLRQGHGRVVNMGSLGGRLVSPFMSPYNASKFALEAITDALRMELHPWNIQVSIIEPGPVATPIWRKGLEAGDELMARQPTGAALYGGRMEKMRAFARHQDSAGASPEQVAEAVAHALTAARPKTRYSVGRGVRLIIALGLVPDRLRDRIMRA